MSNSNHKNQNYKNQQNQAPQSANQNQAPQKVQEKSPVDSVKYDRYVSLKLIDMADKNEDFRMKEEDIKLMNILEKEILQCKGAKSKVSRTPAVKNEIIKLIKGIPVPEAIEKIITDAGLFDLYLEK